MQTDYGPEKLTTENVQHWCNHAKELEHTQVSKALKFVKHDCIKYIGYDEEFGSKYTFLCLPLNQQDTWEVDGRIFEKIPYLKNYNSSEYKIYKNENNVFECNCQGWQTRAKNGDLLDDGCNCAHILALFFCFKLKIFGEKEGAEEKHLRIDR